MAQWHTVMAIQPQPVVTVTISDILPDLVTAIAIHSPASEVKTEINCDKTDKLSSERKVSMFDADH